MNTVLVVILVVGVLVVAGVALSRTTNRVEDARDEEYLELEGNWVRYRVTGGGAPILLVHGLLSSGRVWERTVERLAQRFTVYSLDLPGFGESDKPLSGYGVRYGSRLLYAFCAHFGITRAAVVGHDVGGAMAVKLAADHPDVVGRLVLVATPAREGQMDLPTPLWLATLPVIGPLFYTLGRFVRPLRSLWMRPLVLDPDDLSEEAIEDAGRSTPAALSRTLSVMRREISRDRLVRQAGILKVPILVVAGEDDRIVDPEAADDWTRIVPSEAVLLDDCGHLPMLERPEELDARILAFLTGDPRYLEDATTEFPEAPEEDPTLAPEEPPAEPPIAFRPKNGGYPPPDLADRHEGRPGPGEPAEPTEDAADEEERSPREEEVYWGRPGESETRSAEPETAEPEGGAGEREENAREVPEGLFQWPESLNEPKPWDLPHDDDTLDRREEESAEGTEPERDPDKRSPGPEGPGPEKEPDR